MVEIFPFASDPIQLSNCIPPDAPGELLRSGYKNCYTFPANLMNVTKVSGTITTSKPICSYQCTYYVNGKCAQPYYAYTPIGCNQGQIGEVHLYLYVSYVQNPGAYDWSFEGGCGMSHSCSGGNMENFTFDLTTDFGALNIAGPIYWMKLILTDYAGFYGSMALITVNGVAEFNPPTPPGPICTTTCCEGDTRTANCPLYGTYGQVCLCPGGNCQWWDAEGKNCPVCWPGDQESCHTCYDGSQVCDYYCDNGQWYPTYETCPVCNCTEGTYRTPTTCWNGEVIYAEVCRNCGWTATGDSCPPCGCVEGTENDPTLCPGFTDGTHIHTQVCHNCGWVNTGQVCPTCGCVEGTESAPVQCWDGTHIHNMICHNCKMVLTGQKCPPKPAKGTLSIVGTCPDGSPMYEKWNGTQWVAVACPKPKRR